jgi:carbon monoxide dehydrogenase subunit G
MTQIESKKVTVNAAPEAVFDYLSDMNHFAELLPRDRISDWKSDSRSCSFKISGAYTIGLEQDTLTPHSALLLKSSAGAPFKFTLDIRLAAAGAGTEAYQVIEADLNPFLKMIVETPLRNLFDYIADRLSKRFENG